MTTRTQEYQRRYYWEHREQLLSKNKRWRAQNSRKQRDARLRKAFGITLNRYEELLTVQSGCCKICGSDKARGKGAFHVDHCHETNVVRGLLCHSCNVGLGQFKHSVDLMLNAVAYLRI